LVAVYQPVVYRMARRGGLSHESAEDVIQGVFLSVSQALNRWESRPQGPRFRHWLGRVARNAVLNALTRAKPDCAAGSSSIVRRLEEVPADGDLTESLLRETRLEAIRFAAGLIEAEFSPKTWAMFEATSIVGKSAEEVAREFGCSLGSVYASRCRVTARLRAKVSELSDLWSDEE
jgi:RNA polymerase sigma-70 factor (ECF subfamily)